MAEPDSERGFETKPATGYDENAAAGYERNAAAGYDENAAITPEAEPDEEALRRQAEARARLRAQTAELRRQAAQQAAQARTVSAPNQTNDADVPFEEAAEDAPQTKPKKKRRWSDAAVRETAEPRSRELDPAGPPWNYDKEVKKKPVRDIDELPEDEAVSQGDAAASKKTSVLGVRARSGLIYILITIVCVLASDVTFVLMLMVLAGICAGEFYYMLRSDAKLPNEILGIIGAVLYPPAVYFYGAQGAIVISLALMMALLVWYVFWLRSRIPDVGISFFGAAYTGLFLSGLICISLAIGGFWGRLVVLLLFVSAWVNDAFAYLIGSRFGKHKLAPRTSPKKSWEGFFAGLVGSVLLWIAIAFVPGVSLPIPLAILFGIICGAIEVLGDLVESRIKRNSGFKDSGRIMPGHGGLLDRSDSMLLVSVAAYALLIIGGCIPYVL